jgi:uncharacterized protein YwqG
MPPSDNDEIDPELLAALQPVRRPALKLIKSEEGASLLGGEPLAPEGFEWPSWNGEALDHLCQIDLSQAGATDLSLPEDGLLTFFFAAQEQPWGSEPSDRGGWRVYLFPKEGLVQATAPEEPAPKHRLILEPMDSYPSGERLSDDDWDLDDDQLEEVDGLVEAAFDGQPTHQLGGYPAPIQNDEMGYSCELAFHGFGGGTGKKVTADEIARFRESGDCWRLLLQLDSDEEAGFCWGDVGKLYFWIREDDLRAHNFDDVWVQLQCY